MAALSRQLLAAGGALEKSGKPRREIRSGEP